MKKLYKILFLITLLTTISCKKNYDCFEKYENKSKHWGKSFIKIKSSETSENGCIYQVQTYISINDSVSINKAKLYLKNRKIYMNCEDLKIDDFLLFDLTLSEKKEYEIKIRFNDKTKIFQCSYENDYLIKKNIKVKKFRIKNIFLYQPDFDENKYFPMDGVFFVTENYGIIGDYLIGDNDWIISPSGNILEDYIDYSDKTFGKLL